MERTFRTAVTSAVTLLLTLTLASGVASSAPPRLSSELVSISQMPKGWNVIKPTGIVQDGCLSNVVSLGRGLMAKGIQQTSFARVVFQYGPGLPAAAEMLASYANPTGANAKILASLSTCKHVSGDMLGAKVVGTIKKKSFAHVGNESQAFSAITTIKGNNIAIDILLVRKGGDIACLMEGGLPNFDVHQFQNLATKALTKIH
jgi:hypothetical protein